jgi:hypothetical protein
MKKLGVYSIVSLFVFSGLFVMFNIPNTAVLAPIESIDDGDDIISPKAADDGYESGSGNDVFGNAWDLTLPYSNISLSCEDEDWYRFWVNDNDLISVDLYFIHDSGNLKLDLYNDGQGWIDGQNSWDNNEHLNYIAYYTGWYYLRVDFWDFPNLDYGLDITTTSPQPVFDDDFESGLKPEWSISGADNFWHLNDSAGLSGSWGLWCGNESSGVYNKQNSTFDDIAYEDSAFLEDLDFSNMSMIELEIWFKKMTTPTPQDYFGILPEIGSLNIYFNPRYDDHSIEVDNIGNAGSWQQRTIDISALGGYEDVDLEFVLKCDDFDNGYSEFRD